MDRSTPFNLIARTYTEDAIGQQIPVETKRSVFGNIESIGQNEFFSAGQQGIRAELRVTMFEPDYQGEEIAEVTLRGETTRLLVYRTFRGRNESLELYLGKRVGA